MFVLGSLNNLIILDILCYNTQYSIVDNISSKQVK